MRQLGLRTAALLGLVAGLLAQAAQCQVTSSADDNPVFELDELILRWIAIEQQANELATNWRQQQPVLEQRLVLLEREEEELGRILAESRATRGEVQARRLELLEEQTALEREQQSLEQTLNGTIVELEDARSGLPPPLQDAWSESLSRLRNDSPSDSERLQLVVDMLAQLTDFQNKITLHEEVVRGDGASPYLVRQVYLGLSHGWYVSADRSRAAYGYATDDGWRWHASDDAEIIAEFISVAEGRQPAALLSIPVELSMSVSNAARDAPP